MKKNILVLMNFLAVSLVGCTVLGDETLTNSTLEEERVDVDEIDDQNGGIEYAISEGVVFVEHGSSFDGFPGEVGDVISLYEAGNIAVRYVFDVLEDDLDGKYLILMMRFDHQINHSTWQIMVVDDPTDVHDDYFMMANFQEEFTVSKIHISIDATTGERISFMRHLEFENLNSAEQIERFSELTAEKIDYYTEIATSFAERHFIDSYIEVVEFGNFGAVGFSQEGLPLLNFHAINDAGKIMDIVIERGTGELWLMHVPISFFAER